MDLLKISLTGLFSLAFCQENLSNTKLHLMLVASQGPDTLWACVEYSGPNPELFQAQLSANAKASQQQIQWLQSCTQPKPKAQCLHMIAAPTSELKADWFFNMKAPDSTLNEFYLEYAKICRENQGNWSMLDQ